MKYYGIFDQNSNYKLLRYSNAEQESRTYKYFDISTKMYNEIIEICLPDIEYSIDNIGKNYNLDTKTFN